MIKLLANEIDSFYFKVAQSRVEDLAPYLHDIQTSDFDQLLLSTETNL